MTQGVPSAPADHARPALRTLVFDGKTLHPRVANRQVLRSAVPWVRPPPYFVLDLSNRPQPIDRLTPRRVTTVPRVLDRFMDAHLVWSDCFILGSLFQDSYYQAGDYHPRKMASLPEAAPSRRHSGIALGVDGIGVAEEKFAGPIEINERCMFATPHEPHHWGLWLTSSMVAIERFRAKRTRYAKLFVHINHPNMATMLRFMGIRDSDIIEHDVSRTYHFHTIDVLRTPGMDFHVYGDEHAMFRDLAVRHGEGRPERRIFISRRTRSGDGYRRLLNEDELEAAMAGLGFAIVEPALLPPAVQMRLFAEADVIAGLGGGSMFNAVFCRPGTKILDIEASTIFIDRHANLFASLGLCYAIILGAQEGADPSSANGAWRLDVPAALPWIRKFLAA